MFRNMISQINDTICFPRILDCTCLLPRFFGALGTRLSLGRRIV